MDQIIFFKHRNGIFFTGGSAVGAAGIAGTVIYRVAPQILNISIDKIWIV